MASQRTSVKVTRIIDVTAEEIEHFTNGIGAVNFELSSGPFLRGATIIATTEESNKTVEIS
jgi:hypothetical protein